MLLTVLGFLQVSFTDILDILMVAAIIFVIFRWIRGTSAMNIFVAIILLYLIKIIVSALNMTMMSGIMSTVIDVGVIALIIIFQPEIRYFLTKLGGRNGLAGNGLRFIDKILGRTGQSMGSGSTAEVVEAIRTMSEQRTGALMVFVRKDALQQIIETGDTLDAKISKRLILNIFFKNSPLHDGAMILNGDRIVAVRCTLPITERTNIPAHYGMRHKAAIGISEECDADIVVVSEETGNISYAHDGEIKTLGKADELKTILNSNN